MKRAIRRLFAFLLIFSVALPLGGLQTRADASAYRDVPGHWAAERIARWSGLGVISGYNGAFRPDDTITRGELASIIQMMMGFPDIGENFFTDTAGKWYALAVNTLNFYQAYPLAEDGKAQGDAALTREEAFYMLAASFGVGADNDKKNPLNVFIDNSDIKADYWTTLGHLYQAGYIGGYPDSTLRPKQKITRAEITAVLDSIVTVYIDKPGVYTGALKETDNVFIAVPGVTLQDRDIHALTVSPRAALGKTVFAGGTAKYLSAWTRDDSLDIADKAASITKNFPLHVIDTRFAGGYGYKDSPYLIANETQLKLIGEFLNRYPDRYYFRLTQEIQLTGTWQPIGANTGNANDDRFSGGLDGAGHKISGMNIKAVTAESVQGYARVGLFRSLRSARIENLTLSGSISASGATMLVGGIAGNSEFGAFENCAVNVTIDAQSSGRVCAGGVVGEDSFGDLINCRVSGDIRAVTTTEKTGNFSEAGGAVGRASSTAISGCASSAKVFASGGEQSTAGGIVGIVARSGSTDQIKNSYATGSVHAEGAFFQNNAGGFSGQVHSTIIESCWASGGVSVGNYEYAINVAGGFASGLYDNVTVTHCYATGAVTEYDYFSIGMIGGMVGSVGATLWYCYAAGQSAVVPVPDGPKVDVSGLFGMLRDSRGNVDHCFDLTTAKPRRVEMYDEPEDMLAIPLDKLYEMNTYGAYGMDPMVHWKMPGTGSSYLLPILQGVDEAAQKAQPMPRQFAPKL